MDLHPYIISGGALLEQAGATTPSTFSIFLTFLIFLKLYKFKIC